jgi:hypothetical protein
VIAYSVYLYVSFIWLQALYQAILKPSIVLTTTE